MKNILAKIYLHPLFVITLFIFVLIGRFRFIIYFMILILLHELGHIFISLIFKWKITKIIVLPFGGLTKYDILINTPIIEEFFVSISGVLFQTFFYIITNNYIDYKYFSFIHYFILFFNLLPIYPLDGSKILNILFNKITNFKNSILLTVIISYSTIFILALLLFNINKIIFMIFIFLFIEVNKLYNEKDLIFNKFLFERYINDLKFKKEKVVNDVNKMKKGYRHLFYINNKYMTEKTFLKQKFHYK